MLWADGYFPKNAGQNNEQSKWKIGQTVSVNIGSEDSFQIPYVGAQCIEQEKGMFLALFREFRDIFAWSYKDLRGLDPGIIKHSIPLEEGAKPVRKRKRLVNPNLDAVIRKGLDKMLEANVIFPVRYSKCQSSSGSEKEWRHPALCRL